MCSSQHHYNLYGIAIVHQLLFHQMIRVINFNSRYIPKYHKSRNRLVIICLDCRGSPKHKIILLLPFIIPKLIGGPAIM